MADEGLSALAHDLPVIRLLDDDPAAGFRVLVPLSAQILDVCEARPGGLGWGRGRLSGADLGLLDRWDPARLPRQGADALECLCGLLLPLGRLSLGGLNALLACGPRRWLHGLPLRRLNALLLAGDHLLALLRLLGLALRRHRLPLGGPLLARHHLLALLRLLALGLDWRLALCLHRLPRSGQSVLLGLYRRLAGRRRRLPRNHRLLNYRPLLILVLGLLLILRLRLLF
jgi:hypothetical protein